jgi:hypothetical protein
MVVVMKLIGSGARDLGYKFLDDIVILSRKNPIFCTRDAHRHIPSGLDPPSALNHSDTTLLAGEIS